MARKKAISSKQFANEMVGMRLSSHEKLCAERMKTLIEAIKDLRKDVNELKNTVSKGKGMVAVLVFLGTIIAAVLGWFNIR
tara:strand:+ start:76 stop:318 length:243 start_codon:yes stop_codon:yes gene_type:complete